MSYAALLDKFEKEADQSLYHELVVENFPFEDEDYGPPPINFETQHANIVHDCLDEARKLAKGNKKIEKKLDEIERKILAYSRLKPSPHRPLTYKNALITYQENIEEYKELAAKFDREILIDAMKKNVDDISNKPHKPGLGL